MMSPNKERIEHLNEIKNLMSGLAFWEYNKREDKKSIDEEIKI